MENKKVNLGKVLIAELLEQLRKEKNPVSAWSIRECIIDRLKRKDYD
jgi:hypothetical protein